MHVVSWIFGGNVLAGDVRKGVPSAGMVLETTVYPIVGVVGRQNEQSLSDYNSYVGSIIDM